MLTVVSVLTCGRSLNSKHHLAEKICETCATLNHSNFQFEAEPEAVEKNLKIKEQKKKFRELNFHPFIFLPNSLQSVEAKCFVLFHWHRDGCG